MDKTRDKDQGLCCWKYLVREFEMMKYDDVEDRFKEMKRFHRTKWMNGCNGMTKQWSLEFDCCSFGSCLDIICVDLGLK